jgi:hypothetical protein
MQKTRFPQGPVAPDLVQRARKGEILTSKIVAFGDPIAFRFCSRQNAQCQVAFHREKAALHDVGDAGKGIENALKRFRK